MGSLNEKNKYRRREKKKQMAICAMHLSMAMVRSQCRGGGEGTDLNYVKKNKVVTSETFGEYLLTWSGKVRGELELRNFIS